MFKKWLVPLSSTALIQCGLQAIGYCLSIALIRVLPPTEFSLFTIAISAAGLLTVLSDSGVAAGLMALGGKNCTDAKALGIVYSEGMRLRLKMSGWACLVATPFVYFLLFKQGARWFAATLLVIFTLICFYATLSGQMRENVLKLHQKLRIIQSLHLGLSTVRIAVVPLFATFLPYAWAAMGIYAISQLWHNIQLGKSVGNLIITDVGPEREVRDAYWGFVKKTMPGSIYFAVSGQLAVFLLTVFGKGEAVAEIGVVGRLAAICNILSAVLHLVVYPRFSRLSSERERLLKLYFGTLVGIALFGALTLFVLQLFPKLVGYLAGNNYAGLETEMSLAVAAGMLGVLSGSAYALGAVRGIIVSPWLSIPSMLILQIFLLFTIDVSSVGSVLMMSVCTAALPVFLNVGCFLYELRKDH